MLKPVDILGRYHGGAIAGFGAAVDRHWAAAAPPGASVIYDGGSCGETAKRGTIGCQIIRDRTLAFNAEEPDGLLTGMSSGQTQLLSVSSGRRAFWSALVVPHFLGNKAPSTCSRPAQTLALNIGSTRCGLSEQTSQR